MDSRSKAYTPLPNVEQPRNRSRIRVVAAVAVAATLAGIGIVSQMSNKQLPAASTTAAPASQTNEAHVLFLTSQDFDRDATEQAKAALVRGEIPPALQHTPPEVRQQIASGEQQLYTVRLMDFADEDRDAVNITVNGVSLGELALVNTGGRLTIPLKPGQRSTISVTAVRDGGGGVTFRAISSRGEMRTRVMAVGESERWAVDFQ